MTAATGAHPSPTDLIPHRPPFLFVDEIVELEPGVRARARFEVSPELPLFDGHFPGNPILPGVVIVEALAQTGALAAAAMPESSGKLALFAGIDRARFRRVVRPGDVLDLQTTVTRQRGPIGEAEGEALVDGERACEAKLRFAFVDEESA
jgi:3-hydroxyacyl-[acyl-carrier-protein] dehydratase